MGPDTYNQILQLRFINGEKIVDVHTVTEPSSLMRGYQIDTNGVFRLSRRTCELHSVKVICQGSCGFLEVYTGMGRPLFRQPSVFSGSFALNIESEDGLIVKAEAGVPASIQLSWREPDAELV